MINTSFSNDSAPNRTPAGEQKKKDRRFPRKKPFLGRKGHNEGKCKPNVGTGPPGATPPRHNGPSTDDPRIPTVTQNTSHLGGAAGASAPSTSAHSQNKGSGKPTATPASVGIPSKYLAIDCEMVGAGPKGRISHLARCSVVSYDGDVVYDTFIKPSVPVTDYRTRWSGIRHRDLINATPYSEARKEIVKLLAGKVVIGHAIHNDFKALGYTHPAVLTRDTSRIPLLNAKAGFAETEVASLKRLTKALFNRDIQSGRKGHSSVEDARATMQLYRVVEAEWERNLASSPQAS